MKQQKRIRQSEAGDCEENSSDSRDGIHSEDLRTKRPRENSGGGDFADETSMEPNVFLNDHVNDDEMSDSDFDDADDFETPTNMDDFLDDPEDDEEDFDDGCSSTASTRTSMSTGSVGSNTPSLVGENLESFSLTGEGGAAEGVSKVGGPVVHSTEPPLRRSLFSHVPPSINFVHHNEVPEITLPADLRKTLRWKLSNITPAVVKKVVNNSGFRLMRKSCSGSEWAGTWGKHMKSNMFKDLSENQKINHFPGTFNIGRKDRLWKNYQKLRVRFGRNEFNFLPRTFCLPQDTKSLRRVWEKRGVRAKWIIKPPALARGCGIKVVNKWSQIPKSRPLIVQRYISKPHLINGTKYDLRIYVLVTSLCPLRIFLYDEGLARFASNAYEPDNDRIGDVFMHLTNYSINKNSATYVSNDDPDLRQGHKWTLSALWQHFAEAGIDHTVVWNRIKDMVIKTIMSAEHAMYQLYRSNLASHYSCFELFGFDVLLDSELKPWLIEVNISPSLHSSSSLDLEVKSPLATEVFNIARYHVPSKISPKAQKAILQKLKMEETGISTLSYDQRLYTRDVSKAERAKHNRFVAMADRRNEYLPAILEKLTPDDVRFLIRAEDEMTQLRHFSRIFPTQDTHKYFRFLQQPRYYNMLFDAWEVAYGDCRSAGIDRLEQLCQQKVHLKVPSAAVTTASTAAASSSVDNASSAPTSAKSQDGVRRGSMASKKDLDLSKLKAPTGTSAAPPAARPASPAATHGGSPPKQPGSAKKSGSVAKPPSQSSSQDQPSEAAASQKECEAAAQKRPVSSPEPMSTSCDSRSPSPTPAQEEMPAPSESEARIDAVPEQTCSSSSC